VQLGLLRMCAARGDLLAVLSLPEQYSDRDAVSHVLALKGSGPVAGGLPDPVFGFGATYHPWLYCADSADPALILRTPPDGAAAGVIAARTLAHGAWVAPANVALRGVVALDPPIGPGAYAELQAAQVNLVRQEPAGFLCLAADTLSDADELRPIGVRRLLQVLRRTALLHGASYAFEGNGDVVRRTVQRGFERILARMFALGAFAGATAAEAFAVTVLAPVDSGADGQLVIELQVAPSRPLSFITVRLVRSGGGGLQVVLS
jgi:phage tail sheath protein FI